MSALAPVTVVPLYAGFWRRAGAWVIDAFLLLVPNAFIGWHYGPDSMNTFAASIAIAALYYAGFHASSLQATPGKLALGVKVTNLEGERIGVLRALVRYFATWLSTVVLGLGYLLAGVTKRRKALHDMIAGTLVVNRKAMPHEVVAGGGVMPVTAGVAVAIVLVLLMPFMGGVIAAIALPAYQDYLVRAKVGETLWYGENMRGDVERSLARDEPYQGGGAPGPMPASAQAIEVNERGEIVMTLAPSVADGGKVILTPTRAEGAVTWKCRAQGVASKYLPERCRS